MHNYLPAGAVARPPPRPPKPNPPGPRLAGPGCAAATATCSAASVDAVRCYPSLPARPETACQPHVAACEQPPGRDPAGAGQHRHRRSLRSPVSRSRTEVAAVWPSSRTPTRWIPPVSVAAQPRSSGRTLTRWAPPVSVSRLAAIRQVLRPRLSSQYQRTLPKGSEISPPHGTAKPDFQPLRSRLWPLTHTRGERSAGERLGCRKTYSEPTVAERLTKLDSNTLHTGVNQTTLNQFSPLL
jgi:hypothetical protein